MTRAASDELKEIILEVRSDVKEINKTLLEMAVQIESLSVKQNSANAILERHEKEISLHSGKLEDLHAKTFLIAAGASAAIAAFFSRFLK